MKRFTAWAFAVLMLLSCPSGLAQAGYMVKPLPVQAQMDALAGQTFVAIPLAVDAQSRTLTLQILEAETFDAAALEAVKPGDTLLSGGKVYLVEQMEYLETGAYVINPQEGIFTDNWLLLARMENGQYQSTYVHDWVWNVVGDGAFTLAPDALFRDWIDPEHGDKLEEPREYASEKWIMLFAEHQQGIQLDLPYQIGFDIHNFWVTFNEKGEISLLERFYVEWQ